MLVFFVALGVLVLDQIVKAIVVKNMVLYQSIPVIKGFFHLTYVLNPGAAFSILRNQTTFFIIITILVVVFIVFYIPKIPKNNYFMLIGFGSVVGGALGNLLDRIRLAKVIDYLDFRFWPVFNIADMGIVIGVGLLLIGFWQEEKRQKA
jgi:signal peptidase II